MFVLHPQAVSFNATRYEAISASRIHVLQVFMSLSAKVHLFVYAMHFDQDTNGSQDESELKNIPGKHASP